MHDSLAKVENFFYLASNFLKTWIWISSRNPNHFENTLTYVMKRGLDGFILLQKQDKNLLTLSFNKTELKKLTSTVDWKNMSYCNIFIVDVFCELCHGALTILGPTQKSLGFLNHFMNMFIFFTILTCFKYLNCDGLLDTILLNPTYVLVFLF